MGPSELLSEEPSQPACRLGFVSSEDLLSSSLVTSSGGNILYLAQSPHRPRLPSSQTVTEDHHSSERETQSHAKPTLRKVETRFDPDTIAYLAERGSELYTISDLFALQTEISTKQRFILVDWLMEVSDRFQLKRQTFYLAVHYADTYLSRTQIRLGQYQLLGVTSLFIACKVEEIYFPKIADFYHITDGKCPPKDIFELEVQILMKLQWLLNPTTLHNWAQIFMLKWDAYATENPLELSLLHFSQVTHQRFGFDSASNLSVKLFLSSEPRKLPRFLSDEPDDYLLFRLAFQVLDLALLDSERPPVQSLAVSALLACLALALDTQFEDPDSEFAHLVASFAERCGVDTLCLEYVVSFLRAAPLQQHMPSIMEPRESQESEFVVASQEELYAF